MAFGNYLNSSKRGPAYGFKLQSLDNLLDTKASDKKSSLLHYIATTVRKQFPDLLNFESDFYCIEEASQYSLENILTDVADLEKGMDAIKKEIDVGIKGTHNQILKEFIVNYDEKLKKTQRETTAAKVSRAAFEINLNK